MFHSKHILTALMALLPLAGMLCAKTDISLANAVALPTGRISDYAFGSVAFGVGGRVGFEANRNLTIYGQANYLDFGVENGYIPQDKVNSTVALDIATDFYIVQFGPGISLEMRGGSIRPYADLFCGAIYYSTLSRVTSRDIQPDLVKFSRTGGVTWQAGISTGVRMLIWEPQNRTEPGFLDLIFFDFNVGFYPGGKLELLDWRAVRFFEGELQNPDMVSRADLILFNIGVNIKI